MSDDPWEAKEAAECRDRAEQQLEAERDELRETLDAWIELAGQNGQAYLAEHEKVVKLEAEVLARQQVLESACHAGRMDWDECRRLEAGLNALLEVIDNLKAHFRAETLPDGQAMDTPTRDAALFGLSLVRQQIEKLVPAKIEEVEAPVLDLARIKEDARRALSVVIRTLCVRCGPGVNIDKRGFCWICGCPAIGDGLKAYVQDIRVLVEIPGLVKEIERLYGLRSTIDARFRLEGDDLHVKVEGPAHLEKEVAEKAVTVVELYFACAADEERLELRRQVAAQRAELADRRAFDDRLAVVAERLQSLSLGPAGGMLHEQAADALERLKGLAGTLESNAFRIRSVSVREEEHARAGAMEMAAKQITWAMRGVQLDAT